MSSTKHMIWLLCAGLAGCLLILVATSRYGAGVSPDSVVYLAVAENLLEGRGATHYTGEPRTLQPPLYSAVLAVLAAGEGARLEGAARVLNAALFGLILMMTGRLAYRFTRSWPMAWACAAVIAVTRPLQDAAVMAWSEPLFIFLTLLFLWGLDVYSRAPSNRLVLFLALIAAAATLTRYIGVTLIGTGVIGLFLLADGSLKRRVLQSVFFAIPATAPLLVWWIRNYSLSGTFMGQVLPSQTSFTQNLLLFGEALWASVFPLGVVSRIPSALTGGLCALIILGYALALGRRVLRAPYKLAGAQHVAAIFAGLYSALLVYTSTTTLYDAINVRLISPMFVPAVLWVGLLVHEHSFGRMRRLVTVSVIGLCVVALSVSALFIARYVQAGVPGYNHERWREGDLVAQLLAGDGPDAEVLYTNDPGALYYFAGRSAVPVPHRESLDPDQPVRDAQDWVGRWPEQDGGLLVWFEQASALRQFTREEVMSMADVEILQHYEDGFIARISRLGAGVPSH